MAEGASLDSGDLAGVVLKRASPIDIPSIAWRALSAARALAGHRHVHGVQRRSSGCSVRSLDDRPLPLQVDGDYIGERPRGSVLVPARGMLVVA